MNDKASDAALADSPQLQAKLNELRGVSELLQSLPKAKLGHDLGATLRLDTPVRASAGLPWNYGLTAGALVAASLVAGVLWVQSNHIGLGEPEATVARDDSVSKSLALVKAAEDESRVETDSEDFSNLMTAMDSVRIAEPGSGDDSGVDSDGVGLAAADPDHFSGLDANSYYTRSEPEPGELLEVLENVDGQVAIVEYVVLDVDEAVDRLAVTLSSLGVRNTVQDEESRQNDGRLMAVFVQADESIAQAVISTTQSTLVDIAEPNPFNNLAYGIATRSSAVPAPAAPTEPSVDPGSLRQPAGRMVAVDPAPINSELRLRQAKPLREAITFPKTAVASEPELKEEPAAQQGQRLAGQESRTSRFQAPAQQMARSKQFAETPSKDGEDKLRSNSLALYNNYQVPLQVSSESLAKIQLSNGFTRIEEPQRMLFVFRQKPSAAASPPE